MIKDMNSKAASASNLVNAVGFAEFMNGVKNYKIGAQFSIPDALGAELNKVKQAGGSLVTLGKLVKNNVDNGNLSGLDALDTVNGTAKKYLVTGPVKLKKYFSVDYAYKLENPQDAISIEPGEMFVFCNYKSKRGMDDIELIVHTVQTSVENGVPKKKNFELKKKIGECGFDEINTNNVEFPAIQSVWYGFDRVCEMERNGEIDDIGTVYFIGTNQQMMRRVAGCYFGTSINNYDYTQYIQTNFIQFMPGELREINKKLYLAACDKAVMERYMAQFNY